MPNEQVQTAGGNNAAGKVTIKSGVHVHEVPQGMSVADLRREYGPLFRIPEDAGGYSGTTRLDDNTVPAAGAVIEFVKKSGEKGNI
jgi:hypothetical protein